MNTRSRWPVMASALVLLWATGWYSLEGGAGLMVLVAVCAGIAAAPSRPLLRTARAVIWGGLLLGVFAVSVNLARIVPPEGQPDLTRAYLYDRMVTLVLVPALTVLFTRPGRMGITLLTVGSLPMLMLALTRGYDGMAGAANWSPVLVWGGLLLPVLAGQVQLLTSPRPAGAAPVSSGECWRRVWVPVLSLALAVALVPPVSTGTRSVLNWGRGWLGWQQRDRKQLPDSGRLSLAAPPGGFQGRVNPVILIESPSAPGYLREAAYRDYAGGVWINRSGAGAVVPPVMVAADASDRDAGQVYVLPVADGRTVEGPAAVPTPTPTNEVWRMELLPRYGGERMCLPADSLVVQLDADAEIVVDGDGIVQWGDAVPAERRFAVQVGASASRAVLQTSVAGYRLPFPAPADASGYLAIPAPYADAVSNWVAACTGLPAAGSPLEAMQSVVRYFRQTFDYALEPPGGRGDLLLAFMRERRGHCTLFASASTLMLRARGIPARVVGGYVSTEQHPLTGCWVVRERDGHAWCEAWDDQAGCWRLVESTPPGGWPGGFESPGGPRLLAEALAAFWRAFRRWVAELNPLVRVAEAGAWVYVRLLDVVWSGWGATLAVLVVAGGYAWHRRRRRSRPDAVARRRAELMRAMQRIEQRLSPTDCRRGPAETWSGWQRRVAPRQTPAQRQRLAALLADYQHLRYHPELDDARAVAWLEAASSNSHYGLGQPDAKRGFPKESNDRREWQR